MSAFPDLPALAARPVHTAVDASFAQLGSNATGLPLILTGRAPRPVVSVGRQGLFRAAVPAATGPAGPAYDVDAATMHI